MANEERRKIVGEKAVALAKEFEDTNTGNAQAERFFLGISLTCSPADDADSSIVGVVFSPGRWWITQLVFAAPCGGPEDEMMAVVAGDGGSHPTPPQPELIW